MANQDYPEEKLPPVEPGAPESPVDFSDLGPLFSPQAPEQAPVPEQPEAPDTDDSLDFSDLGPLFSSLPEETEPEEAPEEPEAPTYQASDYPEDNPEGGVLPGEAAWLLRKLRELPPDPEDPYEARRQARQEEPEQQPEEQEEDDGLDFLAGLDLSDPEEEVPTHEEVPPEEEAPEAPEASEPEVPEEALEEAPDEASETPATEQEAPAPDSSQEPARKPERKRPRKGRPRRKKGEGFFGIPNLVVTAVWIGLTVLIGVTLGRMVWVCAADVLAFGREDKPVTITIYEADTIDDITRKLHEGELIHYPGLFKLYASLAVDEGEIHPGIWDLNTRYDYHALVSMMSPSSSREVIELMIPEGYSCRQIFALMEEKKICTALDLASYAAAGELDEYWFLEDVPRGDMYCLEGFLFPDTYQFYKNDSPRSVLQKMLNNFNNRFDETMVAQIDSLNLHLEDLMRRGGHGDEYVASHRFDVRDVINVASLIEKETSSAEEGYTIASVIYNRLFNWGDNPSLLNIDATIVYALGGKTDLTQEDLKVDSPYNTYLHTGLTPGPIANPGLASIRAALEPSDTNYYFYVLDPALGSHRFTTTYEEHQAAKASVGG